MSLASSTFLAFVALTVIAFHLSAAIAWRRAVLTIASAVFIGSYVENATELLPLLGFLLLGYAALQVMLRMREREAGASLVLTASIAVVLVVYIFLKRFSFVEALSPLSFPYLVIGLSYILFRILHVMIDARSGGVRGPIGPFAFFRYTCNFLCFVSGPIQRYQDFAASDGIEAAPLTAERVYEAFSRVVAGYVKFVIIAASADYIFNNISPQLMAGSSPGLLKMGVLYAACAAAYTAYLYFNFSGYMDIVIGIGVLLGQALPENFNRPFSARSFLEFWQRWHMTLSEWFKLYLFNPLMMVLLERFPSPSLTAYLGVFAFFVTFLVMGVWHGTTMVFVIYGLLMGAGASINKVWQIACTNRLGKKRYRALTQATGYIYCARGVTFAYFALALTCLWTPELPQFLALGQKLGLLGVACAFAVLAVGFAVLAWVFDSAIGRMTGIAARLHNFSSGLLVRNFSLAGRILAVLAIASLFNKAPDFVYKAF